jgi:acyl-CoA synthetase (AMP-forming)/AMP-acid ligase II
VFTCPRERTDAVALDLPGADEQLVAVAEVNKSQVVEEAVRKAIVAAVQEHMGLKVDEIHFLRRGELPKTSSGKVRRRETRARLVAGTLTMARGSED